jgi:hypothetical protein
MEFYSFTHRKRIDVPDENLKKRRYAAKSGERYSVFGSATVEGKEAKVSKFVSKDTYDKLDLPEENG